MNIFRVDGKFSLLKLLVSILISEGVGALSGIFARNAGPIYQALNLPLFAPPPWAFGPVWIVLYFLMGLAGYRVWMMGSDRPEVQRSIVLYGIQLFFNFLWSLLFFGLGMRGFAFIEILILLTFILATTRSFYKVDKLAGDLMFPYILWVTFASILNLSIWVMNR